jgi:hypothetical protein
MMDTKVTKQEVDGFLGIDTQINVSDKPLEEAIEIIADIINGEYTVEQLRRDIHEWKETWTVIGTKDEVRPAPYAAMSPFESKADLSQRAMEANKARTEILADNPEINSQWTPNAIELMKQKES